MVKGKGIPFNLPTVDELFTTQAERDDANREKVYEVPLSEIDPFPNHPFVVRMDEDMASMVDSIKQYGVIVPTLARVKEDGRYELVSGHRRKYAAELAGLETLPVIVRDMTFDEAVIAMVDANLQREDVLPSEKAFSYKMKVDALRRQAGRPSRNNSAPLGQNKTGVFSRDIVAEESGDSKSQIQRYIRLTELIPEILTLVDEKKIGLRPAVDLSYLPKDEQTMLFGTMECELCTPSHAQAIKLRKFSEEGRLSADVITSIMTEEKPNQKEHFKISTEKLSRFFRPGTTKEKMEERIIKGLELLERQERNRDRER